MECGEFVWNRKEWCEKFRKVERIKRWRKFKGNFRKGGVNEWDVEKWSMECWSGGRRNGNLNKSRNNYKYGFIRKIGRESNNNDEMGGYLEDNSDENV